MSDGRGSGVRSVTGAAVSFQSPIRKVRKNILKKNTEEREKELENFLKRDSKVSIDNKVRDFARIKRAVDLAPDMDKSQRISDLKERVSKGLYEIDYEGLADDILSAEF